MSNRAVFTLAQFVKDRLKCVELMSYPILSDVSGDVVLLSEELLKGEGAHSI